MGIEEANANFAGAHPEQRSSLLTNSLVFAIMLGALSIGCVAALIEIFPAIGGDVPAWLRWAALGSVPILILQLYLQLLLQADYGFKLTNLAWMLGPVTNVAVNGTFAALGRLTVATAVATWIAGQTLGTSLLLVSLVRRPGAFGRADLPLAGRSLSFGVKSHAGRVAMIGNYRLDQWILGAVSGPHALGVYSVAVAWSETLFFLPTSIVTAHRPDLVRASPEAARRRATQVFRATALVTLVSSVIVLLASPFLVTTVFGERFDGAVDDLRILVLGALGIAALKIFSNTLTAQGRPLRSSAGMAIALVVTIALDIALIPTLDDRGAAIASAIAYTVGGVGMAGIFLRSMGGSVAGLIPRSADATATWRVPQRLLRWRAR